MRVGLDVRPALHSSTGIARACRELARALARRGRVELRPYGAAWRKPVPALAAAMPEAVRPRLPARLQSLLAPAGFSVTTLLGPIDLFHHTDLVYAPVRGVPEVVTLHDLLFLRARDGRGEGWHDAGFVGRVEPRVRRAAARAAAVIVPSGQTAADVVARGVARAEAVRVVALGGDHVDDREQPDDSARLAALLARCGLARGVGPLVLALGTREPRKNHAALLEAFLAMASPARLVFAGPRGWGCAALEARLADPALHGRVGVAGDLPEADVQALLRRADVVAYPSLAEGFGLPALEAMRCGRALLTSAGTPMAERGGDSVLAVDPRAPGALREALEALVSAPALRAALGAAARERARPFTWAACAERHERVYEEVSRKPARKAGGDP